MWFNMAASFRVVPWRPGRWGKEVELCFIRPGQPVENGFIESFNGRLRDECLNVGVVCLAARCTSEAGSASITIISVRTARWGVRETRVNRR